MRLRLRGEGGRGREPLIKIGCSSMQMGQNIQPRVFLSYSHQDKQVAGRLADELRAHGAEIWRDEERLALGDNLIDRVAAAIRDSDIFLVLVSSASASSPWVERELAMALATENATRVVPVLLDDAKVPLNLAGVLYLTAARDDLGAAAERILSPARPTGSEIEAVAEVERILATLDVSWQREPSIAGVRPDFLVESGDGQRIVIEVKGRANPSLLEAVDARSQASRLRDLTESEDAIVVVPSVVTALPSAGIIGFGDLRSYLRSRFDEPSDPHHRSPGRPQPTTGADRKTVFASMPFKPQYEDVFWFAMTAAAEAVGATCVRVDREDFDGDIAAKIQEDIESSIGVIADLSESNPDVLFEVGYTRKLGRPCVQICSTALAGLPFNVRNFNTLKYGAGQIHELRQPLIARLRAALE